MKGFIHVWLVTKYFAKNCGFQIDKEQAELARANFSILKKDAQAILDLVGAVSFSIYVIHNLLFLSHNWILNLHTSLFCLSLS